MPQYISLTKLNLQNDLTNNNMTRQRWGFICQRREFSITLKIRYIATYDTPLFNQVGKVILNNDGQVEEEAECYRMIQLTH